MKDIDKTKVGWSYDVAGQTGSKRHYYKDGMSLCKKWQQQFYFHNFDSKSEGSKHANDCGICIARLKEIQH